MPMTNGDRPVVVRRSGCRLCGAADLELVLPLGPMPLANAFLEPHQFADEPSYPLDAHFCHACGLLQLVDVVDPELLFRHYLYVTGTSRTMAAHHERYARTLCDLVGLRETDLVVEVASNDGSLLGSFARCGVRTLGIEPARNLAARSAASGIDTVGEFFTRPLATELRATRQPARVVVANNVLGHVDDPRVLLLACRDLLVNEGMVVVEVPYVGDLVDGLEYDTVYHEHLSYFSIAALLRLCESAGLMAVRLDRLPVHGGSVRLYLTGSGAGHSPAVLAAAEDERRAGFMDAVTYRRFGERVRSHRTALVGRLEQYAAEGRLVVGYGAPAKGNTLLNYCGIDTRLLRYTVDRNPLKVGLYTPGAHIPVRDVSTLGDAPRPDVVLLLAWNLADEVLAQERSHRERGGRFMVPIPEPREV